MKYLLDTNVCIKILKGNSKNVALKISSIDSRDVLIPSVVRFELFYGAYKSLKKEATLATLREFLDCFEDAGFNGIISDLCGRIRADLEIAGTPIGPYDMQIAAIAIHNNLTLITHNTKEFSRIPDLKIEDWE